MIFNNPETAYNNDLLEVSMAAVAAAMSEPSRVKMLCALMDGRAWTATELSVVAEISASTASAHLNKLLIAKLITCLSQGRHRYFRLSGHETAELIEMLMGLSWKNTSYKNNVSKTISPPKSTTPLQLRNARTCYDHLAGELAVKIYDSMVLKEWIVADGSVITLKGREELHKLGVILDPKTKRKACCGCLDWSERRFHLGGDLGAALLIYCEHKGWLTRVHGFREVNITSSGKNAFAKLFNREH